MIELATNNKKVQLKFGLKVLLKTNREFGSIHEGQKQDDGGSRIYMDLATGSDNKLVEFIKLCAPDKLTDDEVIEMLENYMDVNGVEYEEIFNLFMDELNESRFFSKKINDTIKLLEKQQEAQRETAPEKAEELEYMLGLLKRKKSLKTVPEQESQI
ncbi:tail assembly chaperone [Listeria grayi]|uniref:tail assembly chaperone n=1 Tax=Listeria grayi TaxID=1641 RepID=UPI00162548DC|nr:tail assembly chaperone [Listeria grayi]MBC1921980.1 hypothetical protein [Listeria grayi]